MPAAVQFLPHIFAGVGAAGTVKGTMDARKGQKALEEQGTALAASAQKNQVQGERAAANVFTRRRAKRTPGFTDAGAASVGVGAYGSDAALGQ